jgi:MoxR-like ATPase
MIMTDETNNTTWRLFSAAGRKNEEAIDRLRELAPPPWRKFDDRASSTTDQSRWEALQELASQQTKDIARGQNFRLGSKAEDIINAVNAAIYLRRPLLVTGNPGSGKTTLAYAIAYELALGPVLSWPITARSTLQDGLYRYDAIARLQDSNFDRKLTANEQQQTQKEAKDIGEYITLGPLGTAFLPSQFPRVLLIDEIDKSDINLPNDLLNLFEEGKFAIPELVRRSSPSDHSVSDQPTTFRIYTADEDIRSEIAGGRVFCNNFPVIVMTSNGERDFPPAFKRRCLRVRMPDPDDMALQEIVTAHFGDKFLDDDKYRQNFEGILALFRQGSRPSDTATDQLLNAIYMLTYETGKDEDSIKELLLRRLTIND